MKLPGWVASYSDRLKSRLEADVFPALGPRPALRVAVLSRIGGE